MQKAMDRLMKGKTELIIAQRLVDDSATRTGS